MKKRTIRIFVFALIAALALMLAACGQGDAPSGEQGGKQTPSPEPQATETEEVTDGLSAEDRAIIEEFGYLTHHEEVTSDELEWSYDADTATLYIVGSGPMKDYLLEDGYPGWWEYQQNAQHLVVSDGVTSIGMYAFCDFYDLRTVSLPDTIEYIGDSAFYGCYSLEEIPFSADLKEIGMYAFGECKVHKPLTIPEGVEIIGRGAFHANDFLYTIDIPSSVYYISEASFSNSLHVAEFIVSPENKFYTSEDGVLFNKNKTLLLHYPIFGETAEYHIPDTVTRIGDYAFDLTFLLKKLVIPASVSEVGEDQFGILRGLEAYEVDPACTALKVENGVLFSKDGKILYSYPHGVPCEEYVIPEGVEILEMRCFTEANIGKLTLPEGIKMIKEGALSFMHGTDIYLPASFAETVSWVDFNAFASFEDDGLWDMSTASFARTENGENDFQSDTVIVSHMTLHYAGTPEQWEGFWMNNHIELCDTDVVFE